MPTGTSSSEPGPVRRPRAGRPASPDDLRRAQYRQQVLRTELSRVRTAATAWRNGLGVLLAGLVGFGLIKGRSDVSTLARPAAAVVGLLLLAALLAGAAGALLLLRAAHGRPSIVAIGELPPAPISEHQEAIESAHRLRRGISATLLCAALLVTGVALTWYGPPRAQPAVQVEQADGSSVCGTVVRVSAGTMVLKTASGERSVDLAGALGLKPVAACA